MDESLPKPGRFIGMLQNKRTLKKPSWFESGKIPQNQKGLLECFKITGPQKSSWFEWRKATQNQEGLLKCFKIRLPQKPSWFIEAFSQFATRNWLLLI